MPKRLGRLNQTELNYLKCKFGKDTKLPRDVSISQIKQSIREKAKWLLLDISAFLDDTKLLDAYAVLEDIKYTYEKDNGAFGEVDARSVSPYSFAVKYFWRIVLLDATIKDNQLFEMLEYMKQAIPERKKLQDFEKEIIKKIKD